MLPDHAGNLAAGLLPLVSPVVGYAGVDNSSVGVHDGAGEAELADPVDERIVCSQAGDDDLGPVVIELFTQTDKVVSSPAFGCFESVAGALLLAKLCHPGGDVLITVTSVRGPALVALEPVVDAPALFPAGVAQPGQQAKAVEVGCAASGRGIDVR
jgi:hypothetical protein